MIRFPTERLVRLHGIEAEVIRSARSTDARGRVTVSEVDRFFVTVASAIEGAESVRQDADADRSEKARTFLTTHALRVLEHTRDPDVIVYEGERYRLVAIEDYAAESRTFTYRGVLLGVDQ